VRRESVRIKPQKSFMRKATAEEQKLESEDSMTVDKKSSVEEKTPKRQSQRNSFIARAAPFSIV